MPLLCLKIQGMEQQEIQRLRAETSGTAGKIHFNNAGTSFPPDVVVDTVVDYLRQEAVQGGYEIEAARQGELDHVYTLVARLINAHPEEIALVENASTAWHLAFNGITFGKGDIVITSEMEYVTNLLGFLHVRDKYDIQLKVIPNDERGNFSLAALEEAISPKVRMIAITHIASATGGMTPVVEIGKIARKHGILYLVDACQSAGHVPIDVEAIGCDMLSVTGRKYMRAPRGTGFLYVRKAIQDQLEPLMIDGHSTEWVRENEYKLRNDAKRYELFEKNKALLLGLGKAVEYALHIGVDRIWQRIQYLAALLRQRLTAIEGVTVQDRGDQLSGIVTFTVQGMDSGEVKRQLADRQINVSVGQAVSTLFYMNKHQLVTVVRASVHYYNTENEIESLCQALKALSAASKSK
jgi:cysteine desulfurase/selenocysteine lyase